MIQLTRHVYNMTFRNLLRTRFSGPVPWVTMLLSVALSPQDPPRMSKSVAVQLA